MFVRDTYSETHIADMCSELVPNHQAYTPKQEHMELRLQSHFATRLDHSYSFRHAASRIFFLLGRLRGQRERGHSASAVTQGLPCPFPLPVPHHSSDASCRQYASVKWVPPPILHFPLQLVLSLLFSPF